MAVSRRPRRRRWRWPRVGGLALVVLAVATTGVMAERHWLAPASHRRVPATERRPVARPVRVRPPRAPETPVEVPLPAAVTLHVAAQSQLPALPYGCEVTSLSMLLAYAGHPVNKLTLAAEAPRTTVAPVLKTIPGFHGNPLMEVTYWGNPNVGFVGSMTGRNGALGYGMYNHPLVELLNRVWPGHAVNLTGDPFSTVLRYVAGGTPVEVWTTIDFQPTTEWVTWQTPEGPVTITPLEHAVLVVGYTPTAILVNNPYTGEAAEPVSRAQFIASWQQMGSQAVTVRGIAGGSAASADEAR
jgi:uncharacterized protein YvpB